MTDLERYVNSPNFLHLEEKQMYYEITMRAEYIHNHWFAEEPSKVSGLPRIVPDEFYKVAILKNHIDNVMEIT